MVGIVTWLRKVWVADETTGKTQSVDTGGHSDNVIHAHPGQGNVHLVTGDISTSLDYILVDVSDISTYNHLFTGSIHMANLRISVTGDANAEYSISIGYVDNIDGTDGDYYEAYRLEGSRTAGVDKELFYNVAPNGQWFKSGKLATSIESLNDTALNTGTNLRTTVSPGAIATAPGLNDVILRVTRTAGTVNVNVNMVYHSHS